MQADDVTITPGIGATTIASAKSVAEIPIGSQFARCWRPDTTNCDQSATGHWIWGMLTAVPVIRTCGLLGARGPAAQWPSERSVRLQRLIVNCLMAEMQQERSISDTYLRKPEPSCDVWQSIRERRVIGSRSARQPTERDSGSRGRLARTPGWSALGAAWGDRSVRRSIGVHADPGC
jgi:hypothetical protein